MEGRDGEGVLEAEESAGKDAMRRRAADPEALYDDWKSVQLFTSRTHVRALPGSDHVAPNKLTDLQPGESRPACRQSRGAALPHHHSGASGASPHTSELIRNSVRTICARGLDGARQRRAWSAWRSTAGRQRPAETAAGSVGRRAARGPLPTLGFAPHLAVACFSSTRHRTRVTHLAPRSRKTSTAMR